MKHQNPKKTFIVDDDPFWTAILTEILTDLGFTNIVCFDNGKECIDHLHLNPNLVFLDYQMAGIDGLSVLKAVKEYYPGISVVFCTAQEDLRVAVDAMKFGSGDYLLKSNANRKEIAEIVEHIRREAVLQEKIY